MMLEKIKDLLYDLTDFALVILIIIIMTTVISVKITDAMSVNLFSLFNNETAGETAVIDTPEDPIAEKDDEVEEIIIKPEFDESSDNEESTSGETNENNESNDTSETTSTESNKEVTIIIESGSTGYAIAKKLRDNALIEDTSAFINRVEDLQLGAKLQSGTFVLNTSQSLDDMIYTLAGQR
jgi:hypothetical protein